MPRSPIILQVIPDLDTGGAERTVLEVAEAVVRAGGKALVASEGGRLSGELADLGGELVPFPAATKNPAKILANARRLAGLVHARGIDLIHARSRAPAWSALLAARWTKRPFVTTYHGIYNQKSALKGWYNSVMARGDAVIANSRYTAEIVRARHGTPEDRLHVIHRAVDLERFSPAAVRPERIAALKAGWGIAKDARIILQAARLTRWKGQHVLIGAAGLLKDQPCFQNAVIVLAGDHQGRNAYREELQEAIAALGLAEKVFLVGHCADMPAAFAATYAAVIPSIEPEAFGRASIEAQAMGTPVIASNLGALPETLAANSGWTVPAGNVNGLAQALHAALEMPAEIRAAMAGAARSNAERFSKTILQKNTLAVYDFLLATRMANAFVNRVESAEHARHTV